MPEAFVGPMLCCCCFVLGAASAPALAAGADYPPTAKRPVTETYHGVTVVDEYRWLEDDSSPEVKRWVAEENALTRRYLDALPQRPAIAARVGELLRTSPVRRYDFEYRGRLFALKLARSDRAHYDWGSHRGEARHKRRPRFAGSPG